MQPTAPESLALAGPYGIAIHNGQRNDRPKRFAATLGDDCYHLLAVFSGQVVWHTQAQTISSNAPCAFLCPPGRAHHFNCPVASRWEQLVFDVVHVPLARNKLGAARRHLRPAPQPDPLRVWGCVPPVQVPADWLDGCLETLRACGALWWQDDCSWLLANSRLQIWITTYAVAAMQPARSGGDPWLEQVLRIAEDRLGSRFTAVDLARALGLGREALRRRLTALVGVSPGALLEGLRMKRACLALTKTDGQSLGQIAKWCGYGSVPAFCHAFQRRFGTTPGRWRRGVQAGTAP